MKETQKQSLSLSKDFDKIYLRYFMRMCRFAEEYTRSVEDAENIVQDVFTMLWEKRMVLSVQTNLDAYLFSLVKNRCVDYARHLAVIETYQKEYSLKLSALERFEDESVSDKDMVSFVRNAIDKLPDRCREIFLKSRLEGKKYNEIATDLNLSVSTVESQMCIALKKLRAELKGFLSLFF